MEYYAGIVSAFSGKTAIGSISGLDKHEIARKLARPHSTL